MSTSKAETPRATAPLPTIAATRRAIAWQVTRDLVVQLDEAKRAHQELWDAVDDDMELDHFLQIAHDRIEAASRMVLCAVLSHNPKALDSGESLHALEKKFWPPAAMRLDGRLFLACPKPEMVDRNLKVGEEHPKGLQVMHLIEVPAADVADLDVADLDAADGPAG